MEKNGYDLNLSTIKFKSGIAKSVFSHPTIWKSMKVVGNIGEDTESETESESETNSSIESTHNLENTLAADIPRELTQTLQPGRNGFTVEILQGSRERAPVSYTEESSDPDEEDTLQQQESNKRKLEHDDEETGGNVTILKKELAEVREQLASSESIRVELNHDLEDVRAEVKDYEEKVDNLHAELRAPYVSRDQRLAHSSPSSFIKRPKKKSRHYSMSDCGNSILKIPFRNMNVSALLSYIENKKLQSAQDEEYDKAKFFRELIININKVENEYISCKTE